MTFAQSVNHVIERRNVYAAHFRQFFDVSTIVGCRFYSHGLIGTPSRKHLDFEAAFACCDMIFQRIYRVVCRTYGLYVVAAHQVACRVFRSSQFGITFFEYFTCGRGVQDFIDTESGFQFQVSPMIQGVTECVRNSFCPLLEFFPICGVFSGTIAFVYTIATHSTPFIVVTAQPDFCD